MSLLVVDAGGTIHHADAGVRALLGVEPEQCRGRKLSELLPQPELLDALRETVEGQVERQTVEIQLDEPLRHIFAALSPAPLVQVGSPAVSVLLALGDDYHAESDERVALRLRSTVESIISGFAHEVRNPIAAILSITEATLSQLDETPAAAMLARIPGLVNRVDKLIKQSLRYSRPRLPQRSPQPLKALIGWSVELAQMKQPAIDFSAESDERLGPVLVDAEQIEQVLVNLLCNARDAARSQVRLVARRDGGPLRRRGGPTVVIDVSDDGPGVDEQNQSRIFEPFFTTKANGTGLGLAIARDLARLNGGDLVLFSTSERGSTFRLYLEETAAASSGATQAA